MGSKPKRGIARRNIDKLFLLLTQLSGILNFELRDSVFRRTWPYNHVLEHGPLRAISIPNDLLLKFRTLIVYMKYGWNRQVNHNVTGGKKAKQVTLVGRYLIKQSYEQILTEMAGICRAAVPHGDREGGLLLASHGFVDLVTGCG